MNLNGQIGNNPIRQTPHLNAEQPSSQAVIQHQPIRSSPRSRQQTRQTGSRYHDGSTTDNSAGQRGIIAAQRRYARENARGLAPLTIHQPGHSSPTQVISPATRQSPRLLELSQRRSRNPTQTSASPSSSSSQQQQQRKNGKSEWVQVLNPGHEKDPTKLQAGLKSSFKERERKP